jgi:hypothetical protein
MTGSYFTTKDGSWFLPTDHTRGPWSADACHAGPPAALMVRAVEALVTHQQMTRLTIELIRPIPMSGFRVQAEIRRPGRSVTHTEAEIYDEDGFYARAYGLHIRSLDSLDIADGLAEGLDLSNAVPGPFSVSSTHHNEEWFGSSIECKFPQGHSVTQGGPATMWMRTMYPILPDEQPSPFQKIAPLSDCGNGISYHGEIGLISFVNADLTISIHREPIGDWFASRSVSHWHQSGIGMSDSELFDTDGPVGRATQGLVLNKLG